MILTKEDEALMYEILSTNWLYDKLTDSDQFGDRMEEIDYLMFRLMKDVM